MLINYIIYGLSGLLLETVWTGLGSLFSGNYNLTGYTYLWMFFIYGLGVFLEPIHDIVRDKNFLIRGLIWAVLIFAIEFFTGYLLDMVLGRCPWDYSNDTIYSLYGYIRLDFLPIWFIVGLVFEKLHDLVDRYKDILLNN
ncbi:MAG: hypothetical protein AB7V16_03315 [Vulcanibacillus sp.]